MTPHYRPYFEAASLMGMRPSELTALKWGHVDFVHHTIAVREGRVRHVEGLPKIDGSVRDIDMLAPVYETLRRHREGRPIDRPPRCAGASNTQS
jgi:integrase